MANDIAGLFEENDQAWQCACGWWNDSRRRCCTWCNEVPRGRRERDVSKDYSSPIVNSTDPEGCQHNWQPVSMVFETQLLDSDGRVMIRQPDIDQGRVYLVCISCAQHTYMTTNWVGHFLGGSTTRGFAYNPSSSHSYSLDGGKTWRPEKPTEAELELAALEGRR